VTVNEKTRDQLDRIHKITTTLADGSGRAWLFGGWGLDARIGRVTRDHRDIELWVDRHDVQRLLVDAGATVLDTQPPEESAEYNWDGTWFSTAYFDAHSNGTFTTNGRWDDWVFPVGSFPDEPVELEGLPLLAMSVAAMLAMKEQYPHLRNGRTVIRNQTGQSQPRLINEPAILELSRQVQDSELLVTPDCARALYGCVDNADASASGHRGGVLAGLGRALASRRLCGRGAACCSRCMAVASRLVVPPGSTTSCQSWPAATMMRSAQGWCGGLAQISR
jgi:lincosamide nucleotidyltransferase A/C/D/E